MLTKKLDRYIWRELMVPFFIGTLAVLLMFEVNELMWMLKTFSVQSVPKLAIVQGLLYKMPEFLSMTLPVGVSLAASLAMSRLSRETELTAMRVAGAPILRVIVPVAAFGLVISLLNFYDVEHVMPPAERKLRTVETNVGLLGAAPDFRANAVIYLRDYTASFGSVQRQPDDSLKLTEILLIQHQRANETDLITAETGEYRNGQWLLHKTYWRKFKGDKLAIAKAGKDVPINDKIIVGDLFDPPMPEEQTAAQLKLAIANGKKVGSDTRVLEVSYYSRFSMPASCLVFSIVAPIFAILFGRSGFAGVLLSLFLVVLYYNALVVCTEIVGKNGWLNPMLSAWLPNIFFIAVGVIALRRLE
jgi:lipopolysaccharide export system permease protein